MKNSRILIGLVFFFVLGGAIYLLAKPGTKSVAPSENVAADDKNEAHGFSLRDVNGKKIELSDFKGKVVALNFWATWCPPCRKEIPDFIALQNQYGADGLQILGIALDEGGANVVKPFSEKYKITYPILIGDEDIQKDYGPMNAIPVTILIDRKGIIRGRFVGMRTKDMLESVILPLLKEK